MRKRKHATEIGAGSAKGVPCEVAIGESGHLFAKQHLTLWAQADIRCGLECLKGSNDSNADFALRGSEGNGSIYG